MVNDSSHAAARDCFTAPLPRVDSLAALGLRVAAQFGFASAINRDSDEVLVLLGRDAASLSFRRADG